MTDFTREIDARYPSFDEVDAIVKQARQMRARAMRDGAVSFWSMLRRVTAVKPKPVETCEA